MTHVAIIGAGFSGLSAACVLAQEGFKVTVLEKNTTAGGRARKFEAAGFSFDMGPSWYWMPDVFEKFFSHFGKKNCRLLPFRKIRSVLPDHLWEE